MKKPLFIFTDGSAVPPKEKGKLTQGGWSFVATNDKDSKTTNTHAYGYNPNTTINRMELTAVINSIAYCYANMDTISEVVIHTDSKYVADSIYFGWVQSWEQNGWKNSAGKPTSNIDLWKKITNLLTIMKRRRFKIDVRWVKGHNGNVFNEMADALANKGRKERTINEQYA